jgi:hypothetical protein
MCQAPRRIRDNRRSRGTVLRPPGDDLRREPVACHLVGPGVGDSALGDGPVAMAHRRLEALGTGADVAAPDRDAVGARVGRIARRTVPHVQPNVIQQRLAHAAHRSSKRQSPA